MHLLESLSQNGYHEFNDVDRLESILASVESFGRLIPEPEGLNQVLQPHIGTQPSSRSFSYHFGLKRFPLHTDTSFWSVPARYMVLYMNEKSFTSTLVLPADSTREIFLKYREHNPIFSSKTTRGGFYETPWWHSKKDFIKYDPCYMRPINDAAKALTKELETLSTDDVTEIIWTGHNAVVLDNWRCLHGRGEVKEYETRHLRRFYFGENE